MHRIMVVNVKTLKWIALGLVITLLVMITGSILALNSSGVHHEIEARLRDATGFDVSLGAFRPALPLRLGLGPSKLSNAALEIEWESLSLSVNRIWPPFGLDLDVVRPRVVQHELPDRPPDAKPPAKPTDPNAAANGATAIPPMKLALHVEDGDVTTPAAHVTGLNVFFKQSHLMRTPATLNLDAVIKAGPLPAPLPIHVETSSLTFTTTSVAAEAIDARVAGIVATIGGASNLVADQHEWTLKSDAPDLAKVPRPDRQIEAWRGSVQAEVKVKKVKEQLDADGFVDAKDVVATLRAKQSGAEVTGELNAALDVKFGYHGQTLTLPKGHGAFDLTNAIVTYGDLMKKTKGTPLAFVFDATGDGARINVTRLNARFATVNAEGKGQAAASKPFRGHVDLNVAPVELESLVQTLPILAKVPARGRVSFKGALDGPLADLKTARLIIERAALDGPLGNLSVKGRVDDILATKGPRLDVETQAAPLALAGVRAAFPDFKDLVPNGEVRARVKLSGAVMPAKPWVQWPLDVTGEVSAKIPEYVIKTAGPGGAGPAPTPTTAKPNAPAPAGFLPRGYLTEHVRVRVDGEVAKIGFDKLSIVGATARGEVNQGHFRGEGQVAQIFRGRAKVSQLDVPLLEPRPLVGGEATWNGIVIEEAIGFAKPAFKDFANGQTAGRARFKTHLPGELDFLTTLEATGEAAAEPVTLNSVKLGEIINQSIGQIPGVKMDKVKMSPLRGSVNLTFNVAKGVAELPSVVARDVDNSELKLKGRVKLSDLNGDLNGTFAWANSPVGGCMAEGNSDDKHRLLIPIVIRGDLMHPGVGLVGDTLKALGAKALECEGKKLIERAKKDGVEGLKQEAGKVLKGLFGR